MNSNDYIKSLEERIDKLQKDYDLHRDGLYYAIGRFSVTIGSSEKVKSAIEEGVPGLKLKRWEHD